MLYRWRRVPRRTAPASAEASKAEHRYESAEMPGGVGGARILGAMKIDTSQSPRCRLARKPRGLAGVGQHARFLGSWNGGGSLPWQRAYAEAFVKTLTGAIPPEDRFRHRLVLRVLRNAIATTFAGRTRGRDSSQSRPKEDDAGPPRTRPRGRGLRLRHGAVDTSSRSTRRRSGDGVDE